MSKELEALERLIENYYKMCQDTGYDDEYQRTTLPIDYEIIETALKRFRELEIENSEQFKEKWVQDNLAMTFALNVANNKSIAVETIKEKNVCIHDFMKSKTLDEYNSCHEYEEELTPEEFDFLKEVL